MNVIKKAMEQAGTTDDAVVAQTVAVLSESPQEMAQFDHFSMDPTSGYDAAQIAVRLFEGRLLEDFTQFLSDKNLTPNIVLANGMTLLQDSLMRFPQDAGRVECLLALGANPNLFMRSNAEKSMGKSGYRAAYHPLNYAFANCPQQTTIEVCETLRSYGASIEGLKYHLEVNPSMAVVDDEDRLQLRKHLIAFPTDPEKMKIVRRDVDLSVMQKEMANIELQLAAAGFQIVTYVPPVKTPQKTYSEEMVTLPDNYIVMSFKEAHDCWQGASNNNEANAVLGYPGYVSWPGSSGLFEAMGSSRITATVMAKFSSNDSDKLFNWSQPGIGEAFGDATETTVAVKTAKFIFIKNLDRNQFRSYVVGIYKGHNGQQLFFDPITNQVRMLSFNDLKASVGDRSDLIGDVTAVFDFMDFKYNAALQRIVSDLKNVQIDSNNRPVMSQAGIVAIPPSP